MEEYSLLVSDTECVLFINLFEGGAERKVLDDLSDLDSILRQFCVDPLRRPLQTRLNILPTIRNKAFWVENRSREISQLYYRQILILKKSIFCLKAPIYRSMIVHCTSLSPASRIIVAGLVYQMSFTTLWKNEMKFLLIEGQIIWCSLFIQSNSNK